MQNAPPKVDYRPWLLITDGTSFWGRGGGWWAEEINAYTLFLLSENAPLPTRNANLTPRNANLTCMTNFWPRKGIYYAKILPRSQHFLVKLRRITKLTLPRTRGAYPPDLPGAAIKRNKARGRYKVLSFISWSQYFVTFDSPLCRLKIESTPLG